MQNQMIGAVMRKIDAEGGEVSNDDGNGNEIDWKNDPRFRGAN
jgi:hypothetical protein